MQNENENQTEQNEIRAKNANETLQSEKTNFPIVNTQCSVCNSGLLSVIHSLRPTHTLVELAEKIKNEHGVELSKDALSRHFQHYTKTLQTESTKLLWQKFRADLESVTEHQKKVLFIGNIAFEHIVERIDNGTLQLGVEDFEKMVKLYYSVLRDPDSASDNNILAIFQRASDKYGCSLEQGVLIKKSNSD